MPDDPRGRNRRRTAPCVFCARCLKWQRPLTLHLKGWPLIQPTNWLAHTQLSGDNHLTNVWPAPPHMEGASDCTGRRPHVIDNRAHFTLLAHQETWRGGRWQHKFSSVYWCFSRSILGGGCYCGITGSVYRGGRFCSSCWFPYSLLLLMTASELVP